MMDRTLRPNKSDAAERKEQRPDGGRAEEHAQRRVGMDARAGPGSGPYAGKETRNTDTSHRGAGGRVRTRKSVKVSRSHCQRACTTWNTKILAHFHVRAVLQNNQAGSVGTFPPALPVSRRVGKCRHDCWKVGKLLGGKLMDGCGRRCQDSAGSSVGCLPTAPV